MRPNFSQHVPQNVPWRSPVILREQQVANKMSLAVSRHSKVEHMWPKTAFGGSNCKTWVAKNVLDSLKSFWHAIPLPFAVWTHFSECNGVTNSRPCLSQVAPEFYTALKIMKIDNGSPKILEYHRWIFKDRSRPLKTCTESFRIFKYV